MKRVALYHKNRSTTDGYTAECKSCRNKFFDSGRKKADSNLRARFGITIDEYEAQLEKQGGGCAICNVKPRSKRLAVDHDHSQVKAYGAPGIRGSIRGLLCRSCNRWLGTVRDDPTLIERAVTYVTTKDRPFA